MVAGVPSADRTLHSADTDQRRRSAGLRCLCLPDHRQLRTGRTHQRKDGRRLRRWGTPQPEIFAELTDLGAVLSEPQMIGRYVGTTLLDSILDR
jgi:hypothetical protein